MSKRKGNWNGMFHLHYIAYAWFWYPWLFVVCTVLLLLIVYFSQVKNKPWLPWVFILEFGSVANKNGVSCTCKLNVHICIIGYYRGSAVSAGSVYNTCTVRSCRVNCQYMCGGILPGLSVSGSQLNSETMNWILQGELSARVRCPVPVQLDLTGSLSVRDNCIIQVQSDLKGLTVQYLSILILHGWLYSTCTYS
jgi:hypothetical protein